MLVQPSGQVVGMADIIPASRLRFEYIDKECHGKRKDKVKNGWEFKSIKKGRYS